MRFGHFELFVSDVPRARDFYRDVLGFSIEEEQGPPGEPPRTVWLVQDGVSFLLRQGAPSTGDFSRRTNEMHRSEGNLVLYTEDLESTAAALRERGLEFRGDDGPGCLTFTDPDGHWFQLVGPEGM
jgi:catechol 2,3-dioxygenase-like lactoylglutathione lyase family enzyme